MLLAASLPPITLEVSFEAFVGVMAPMPVSPFRQVAEPGLQCRFHHYCRVCLYTIATLAFQR
jgi:hypothetical protein